MNNQGKAEGPLPPRSLLQLAQEGTIGPQTLLQQGPQGPLQSFESVQAQLEKLATGPEAADQSLTWYYKQGGTAFGPIPYPHLEALIRSKCIPASMEVRPSNQGGWTTAQERLQGLFQPSVAAGGAAGKVQKWQHFLATAPLWQLRFGAFLVDAVLGQLLPVLIYPPLFLLMIPYALGTQWYWGATPGKQLFKLRIYALENKAPLSFKAYGARFLGQFGVWIMMGAHVYFYGKASSGFFITTSLVMFLSAHALAAFSQSHQALHDHICGSYVDRAPEP